MMTTNHGRDRKPSIRWFSKQTNVAGRIIRTLLRGFQALGTLLSVVLTRTATPPPAPPPPPPPSSPQSRGCPVQPVDVRASIRDAHLAALSPGVTCAQRRRLPTSPRSNPSAIVAQIDFSFPAAPWPPGPRLCLGRARWKDRIVLARRNLPCVMTRHAALCAGNLKMRQGARTASWCWCWEGGAVAIGDGLHFLLVKQLDWEKLNSPSWNDSICLPGQQGVTSSTVNDFETYGIEIKTHLFLKEKSYILLFKYCLEYES